MGSGDFLHKNAETPLLAYCGAGGAVFQFATNSPQVLDAAQRTFVPLAETTSPADFSIRLWIDDSSRSQPPWPNPYVRGLDHLVFAGFDAESALLADLRERRVIGRFSKGMASDVAYWKMTIFPMLLSIIAGSIGLVELHGSCVAMDQRGLILIGPTGAGKSTLALALTHGGLRFLSDDRTFCSVNQGKLLTWALPRPLKLRRAAAQWFEEFRGREPKDLQNRESVFLCYPTRENESGGMKSCKPHALVFLDRQPGSSYCLTQISSAEAQRRIEPDLLAESPDAICLQAEVIGRLTTLPCWNLRYDGVPQAIGDRLTRDVMPVIGIEGSRCDGEPRQQSAIL